MENAIEKQLSPDDIVTIGVLNLDQAGKLANTRWGKVQFNAEGEADVKLPARDIVKLHELKWLTKDDQDKYLGIVAEETFVTDTTALRDLATQKEVNVRLATRNVELEAKVIEMENYLKDQESRFKLAGDKFEEEWNRRSELQSARIKDLEMQLAEKVNATELEEKTAKPAKTKSEKKNEK